MQETQENKQRQKKKQKFFHVKKNGKTKLSKKKQTTGKHIKTPAHENDILETQLHIDGL